LRTDGLRRARHSIYEFAGGAEAFRALAAHHERCMNDELLNHPFSHGVDPRHVERLGNYWAEVFGGPRLYSKEGGHSAMLSMHAGTGAPDEMGARFAECFLAAIDDTGLPDDPAFRAALGEYIQWAVAEVNSYSPVGATVAPDQPMPRWSWDGLETPTEG